MAHHTIDKAECICQDNTKPCQNHLLDSEDKSGFGNGRLSRSGCLGARESLYKPWFVTITELGTMSDKTNPDSLPAAALPQISKLALNSSTPYPSSVSSFHSGPGKSTNCFITGRGKWNDLSDWQISPYTIPRSNVLPQIPILPRYNAFSNDRVHDQRNPPQERRSEPRRDHNK